MLRSCSPRTSKRRATSREPATDGISRTSVRCRHRQITPNDGETGREPEGIAVQQLTDRVAVVTGAASGIGLGIAKAFADSGMRVMMTDVDEERLERQVAAIGTDRAAGMVCDVADPVAVEA